LQTANSGNHFAVFTCHILTINNSLFDGAKMNNNHTVKNIRSLDNHQQVDLLSVTPNCSRLEDSSTSRKRAMIALSLVLTAAVGCVGLVIGSGAVEASSLPAFTVSNALAAKQDAGVAGIATISVALIFCAALAIVSKKP